jgi:hypothetical protein
MPEATQDQKRITEGNTGDRLTWRQAIILLVAMVAFVFISRAVYDFFHANAHLRPIERQRDADRGNSTNMWGVSALNAASNLMIFAVAIAGPPVVLWYVIRWLGRGGNHRPGIAWAAILFLVAVLVLAALSFQRFFPNCYVWGYMGHCRQMPLVSEA